MAAVTKQRRALRYLIERCCEVDPRCGIHLEGSVARGQERLDSDIDLTIVLTDTLPITMNELITPNNHYRMNRVQSDEYDVNVDINWVIETELRELVRERGAFAWFMFLVGRPIHDPAGVAARSQRLIRDWFERNPEVLRAWKHQQIEVEKAKRDGNHALKFKTQPEFHRARFPISYALTGTYRAKLWDDSDTTDRKV